MQTDSIIGRATPRAASMATQTLSPTRKQGSEKFDEFVEKARNEDLAGKNNCREQASNEAAGIKSPPDSKGVAGEQGALSHSTEDRPDPMTDKNPSRSELTRINTRDGPAVFAQEGDAETEMSLARADLTQSEIAQADQRKSEHQSEIDEAALADQGSGIRDENPAILVAMIAAQSSDPQGSLGVGKPVGAARGAETRVSLATAQTDRQNLELSGQIPSIPSGGSSLPSESGVIGRMGSGIADALSRSHQNGVSPPPALPAASSPKTTPESQVSINGQSRPTAELAKTEQAAIVRFQADVLLAPSASPPQPPAAPDAALATMNGMMRAGESSIANPAGLIGTPDPGSVFSDSEASELNFAGLVESSLQGGPGRSVDYFTGSPQAARLVAGQLADALVTQQGNKVEISLTPAELGRVRMVLSTTESGVLVSIAAERPETLDMIRRHIDQLAEEFRKLGYVGIGFEFSGGHGDGGFDKEPTVTHPDDETGPDNRRGVPASGPEPANRAYVSRGLDLRL